MSISSARNQPTSELRSVGGAYHVPISSDNDLFYLTGMAPYYQHVRKAFDAILRALDAQVGRQWLITKQDNQGKDADDLIT